jgi:uncharacterized repeat protein (TIGR04138 family)
MAINLLTALGSTKYPLEAFLFVQRGLDFTVRRIHKVDKTIDDGPRFHVTGQQLCLGLRDYAIRQYGLMARTVLRRWHINQCEDFGHIVFALVDAGLMHKTEDDSIQDFIGAFNFEESFTPQLQLRENA